MPQIPEEKKELPTIELGGETWAIAPMPARKIMKFGALAMQMDLSQPALAVEKLFECCWLAITTVHKKTDDGTDITFDYFLDNYHVTFEDGLKAMPVMTESAGMKMVPKGEAQADLSVEKNSSKDGIAS